MLRPTPPNVRDGRSRETYFWAIFALCLVALGSSYWIFLSGGGSGSSASRWDSYHNAPDCNTDRLWEWLEKHGVAHARLKVGTFVVQFAGTGNEKFEDLTRKERGVMTQKHVDKGSEILRIPEALLLNEAKFKQLPIAVALEHYPDMNQFDIITLLLLHERAKQKQSLWYPYLCTLPSYESYQARFPYFWSHDKLQPYQQEVKDWVNKARFNLNKKYNMMFPFLSEQYPSIFPAEHHRLQDFLWGIFVVLSRNWAVKNSDGKDVNVLVPMADLLNHDAGAAYVGYPEKDEKGDTWFTMTTNREYKAGEQVYDVYSSECNDYFLIMYGFTMSSVEGQECTRYPWSFS